MDDFFRNNLETFRRLTMAALLVLTFGGCEQLGLGKSKTTNPVVPEPPARNLGSELKASGNRPKAASVKLDGSAAGNGPNNIPNAPGIGNSSSTGSQAVANVAAEGNSEVKAGSSAVITADGTEEAEEARDSAGSANGRKSKVAAGSEDDADDESPTLSGNSAAAQESAKSAKNQHTEHRETVDDSVPVAAQESGADLISPIEVEGSGTPVKNGEIAAMVGGVPIFAEDVLNGMPDEVIRHLAQIEQGVAADKIPPEEARKVRRQLINQFLQPLIEQELLLQAVKSKLKDEQITAASKQLDAMYNSEHLPQLLKSRGFASESELDLELRSHGSSVEALRTAFRNKQLAHQYLGAKVMPKEGFDRPDALKYYNDHKREYFNAAKAKWEHIQLKFSENGGPKGAREKAEEILERLKKGEVFAVLAKECSNGTTASNGGLWVWTSQGSYKVQEVDKAVYEQPIGEIGPLIETARSIDIVRVLERTPAHYQEFEEVQDDIKGHLRNTAYQRGMREVMKDLREKGSIEIFTDKL